MLKKSKLHFFFWLNNLSITKNLLLIDQERIHVPICVVTMSLKAATKIYSLLVSPTVYC